MSYVPTQIPGLGSLAGTALGTATAAYAKSGAIYLGWLGPTGFTPPGGANTLSAQTWINAVSGNFGGIGQDVGTAGLDFQGSFLSFVNSIHDPSNGFNGTFTATTVADLTNSQLDDILGAYGVNVASNANYEGGTGTYDAWAVVNHNSQFAVVPEPSSLLLAALGLLGLAGYGFRRRRQRRSAEPA